ncbi:MAG: hypothetical protein GX061_00425 [Eubacteriaceae bacterium]|nr:hypothetical protein [Eubacteriaceae bacterium]
MSYLSPLLPVGLLPRFALAFSIGIFTAKAAAKLTAGQRADYCMGVAVVYIARRFA